jgi:signal peptidase I
MRASRKILKTPKRIPATEPKRNIIAEWAATILMLLFETTTVAQAFVIPTGSMQDTWLATTY